MLKSVIRRNCAGSLAGKPRRAFCMTRSPLRMASIHFFRPKEDMHAVPKRPKRQPGRPTTRLAKQGIRRMQEMLEQKAEQLSAVIPCSGPVRSCSALLFRQVLQVLRAFCRFFSPPAPIYRDLQGPLWRWPLANARRSNPQWHARDMVCEVAGNVLRVVPRGGRRQFRSVRHSRCPTSLVRSIEYQCVFSRLSHRFRRRRIAAPPSQLNSNQQVGGKASHS